jgi:hypothetical protein
MMILAPPVKAFFNIDGLLWRPIVAIKNHVRCVGVEQPPVRTQL